MSKESPRDPNQSLPKPAASGVPRPAAPGAECGRLLQVDVLCGAGVLQVLLVVLQEGAAGETAPATPSGPPAASLPPPGPARPEGSLFSRPGHYRPYPPFPPILPPRHCACTFPLPGSPRSRSKFPPTSTASLLNFPFPVCPDRTPTPSSVPKSQLRAHLPSGTPEPGWPPAGPALTRPAPLTPRSGPQASSTPGRQRRGRQSG